jgi:hypothetical protein
MQAFKLGAKKDIMPAEKVKLACEFSWLRAGSCDTYCIPTRPSIK